MFIHYWYLHISLTYQWFCLFVLVYICEGDSFWPDFILLELQHSALKYVPFLWWFFRGHCALLQLWGSNQCLPSCRLLWFVSSCRSSECHAVQRLLWLLLLWAPRCHLPHWTRRACAHMPVRDRWPKRSPRTTASISALGPAAGDSCKYT